MIHLVVKRYTLAISTQCRAKKKTLRRNRKHNDNVKINALTLNKQPNDGEKMLQLCDFMNYSGASN